MKMYSAHLSSPLGRLLLVSDGEALCGLYFEGQKHFPASLEAEERPALAVFEKTRAWLDRYFAGEEPEIDVPLRLAGTVFQRAVWERLRKIPYGETISYGELAAELAAGRKRPCPARAGLSSASSEAGKCICPSKYSPQRSSPSLTSSSRPSGEERWAEYIFIK